MRLKGNSLTQWKRTIVSNLHLAVYQQAKTLGLSRLHLVQELGSFNNLQPIFLQ